MAFKYHSPVASCDNYYSNVINNFNKKMGKNKINNFTIDRVYKNKFISSMGKY